MRVINTHLKNSLVLLGLLLMISEVPISGQQTQWPKGVEGCGDTSHLLLKSDGRATWFSPKEMKAMATTRVVPRFPRACRCQGTIFIAVMVNAEGKVQCARKISGHPLLEDVAIDAAKQWVFKPRKKKREAVSFVGLLSFTFESSGGVSF